MTATVAYTDLGSIASFDGQHSVLFQPSGASRRLLADGPPLR